MTFSPFSGLLRANGDAVLNLNLDLSGGDPTHCYLPASIEDLTRTRVIRRMLGFASVTGALRMEYYCGIDLAAGVGVRVVVWDTLNGVEIRDLTDGMVVKAFSEWAALCYDAQTWEYGVGDNAEGFRWSFTKDTFPGSQLGSDTTPSQKNQGLVLPPGHQVRVLLHDDFTGLTQHRFRLVGDTF